MENNSLSTDLTVSLAQPCQMESNGSSTTSLDGRPYADVVRGNGSNVETSTGSQLRTDSFADQSERPSGDTIPNGVWTGVVRNGSQSSQDDGQGPNSKSDLVAYLPNSEPGDDNISHDKQTTGKQLHHQPISIAPVDRAEESKHEDNIAKLDDVERMPDIKGEGHSGIELSIEESDEEDKIHTMHGTIRLSTSGLSIFNSDGLQPKLASDLENFNNGFLEVKKSPIAGYGIFALRDLERFTPILIERELFKANAFNIFQKLEALTAEQLKAYHALHVYTRDPSVDIRVALWRTNRFSTGRGGSVFLVSSRFNHACNGRNNVGYSYDSDRRCMVFKTKTKVSAGEELFITYGGDPVKLFTSWGFRCTCGACAGISDQQVKEILADPWDRPGW